MKTIKRIGKIVKRSFFLGHLNWLICICLGAILYAITKHFYWLLFGIIFGTVFDKDEFKGKRDNSSKEQQKE